MIFHKCGNLFYLYRFEEGYLINNYFAFRMFIYSLNNEVMHVEFETAINHPQVDVAQKESLIKQNSTYNR